MVLRTRATKDDPAAQAALAELCRAYWAPLYAFARRSGHDPQDAEDLTQGFFARVVAKDLLAHADPARGRLRSFLLAAFQHFMAQTWRYEHREKRGGAQPPVSIDAQQAEEAFEASLNPQLSPADVFERRWFETVLERALDALRQEYEARGRGSLFTQLQEHLAWNSAEARLDQVAKQVGLSPGAVRVAIFRLRQRYRELVEEQLAETIVSVDDLDEELRTLRRVLSA